MQQEEPAAVPVQAQQEGVRLRHAHLAVQRGVQQAPRMRTPPL
jgi:hypothetical protein